jgi:hypothetical protein
MDNQIGKKPYGYIYVSFFPPTKRAPFERFYIGQKKLSKGNHYSFDPKYHGSGPLVYRYMKAHPELEIKTIPLIYANSKEELNALEYYWVSFKIIGKNYPDSMNLRTGSNHPGTSEETRLKISKTLLGHPGHRFTQEEKDRMSKTHKGHSGHQFTDKEKARMSEIKKGCPGHPMTEELRHKLSVIHTGLKPSDETKRKMSEARKRHLFLHPESRYNYHPKRKDVICLETGEIFRSSCEANKAYPKAACGTINYCCKKIPHFNTAGGLHWAFLSDTNFTQRD